MQPTYLPWLGYFDLIDQVNDFVFLDNVQLVKRSWQVRNKIKMIDDELYLTIPIKKNTHRDITFINQATIFEGDNWRNCHLKSLEQCYKKSNFYKLVFPFVMEQYEHKTNNLADFTIKFICEISTKIGINTTFTRSSELCNISGKKDSLLTSICKSLDSKYYLSPPGSSVYIESYNPGGDFKNSNIDLYYHNYKHPEYRQLNTPFSPYICILDLLFNQGFDNALKTIRNGRKSAYYHINYRHILNQNL
ncbi:MAG TPA: WbqC family protein [Cytophagaceae bacterium]|nr:WbqC family protein [Cytophagaceae bacterium]